MALRAKDSVKSLVTELKKGRYENIADILAIEATVLNTVETVETVAAAPQHPYEALQVFLGNKRAELLEILKLTPEQAFRTEAQFNLALEACLKGKSLPKPPTVIP